MAHTWVAADPSEPLFVTVSIAYADAQGNTHTKIYIIDCFKFHFEMDNIITMETMSDMIPNEENQ